LRDFVTFDRLQELLMEVALFISYRKLVDYINYGVEVVRIVDNKVTKVRLKNNYSVIDEKNG